MENPFRNYYYYPSSRPHYYSQTPRSVPVFSPYSQSVPVRQPSNSKSEPEPAPQPSTVNPSKPKLVSIPVHFVVSEKIRAVAAIKIQKLFRGFLVRKTVKKIAKIKSEVVEMERRVLGEDTAEMLRRDEKERLRLNEILMSLLFRLDSIRGFDSGVRDCRKMVIKRVIALQEKIDAIAAARDSKDLERMDGAGITDDFDVMKSEGGEALNQTLEFAESTVNQIPEIAVSALNQTSIDHSSESDDASLNRDLESTESAADIAPIIPDPAIVQTHQEQLAEMQAIDEIATEEAPETQISVDLAENNQSSIDEDTDSAVNLAPIIPDPAATMEIQGIDEKGDEGPVSPDRSWEKYAGMMQRMVEENEKLQQLVAELCQGNVLQNRMVGALSQRVEQLERAVARRKSEKKKSGSTSKMRKCGKRL